MGYMVEGVATLAVRAC